MKKIIISLVLVLGIISLVRCQTNQVEKKPVLQPNMVYIESRINVRDSSELYDKYGLKYAYYSYNFFGVNYIKSDVINVFWEDRENAFGSNSFIKIPYEGKDSIYFKKVRNLLFPFAKKYPANVSTYTIFQDYVDSIAIEHVNNKNDYYIESRHLIVDSTTYNLLYPHKDYYYDRYSCKEMLITLESVEKMFSEECKIRKIKNNYVYIEQSGLIDSEFDIFNQFPSHWWGEDCSSFSILNSNILVFYRYVVERLWTIYVGKTILDSVVDINTGEILNYQNCLIDSNTYKISQIFPYGLEIKRKKNIEQDYYWTWEEYIDMDNNLGILTSNRDTILSYLKEGSFLYEHFFNMPKIGEQITIAIPIWEGNMMFSEYVVEEAVVEEAVVEEAVVEEIAEMPAEETVAEEVVAEEYVVEEYVVKEYVVEEDRGSDNQKNKKKNKMDKKERKRQEFIKNEQIKIKKYNELLEYLNK